MRLPDLRQEIAPRPRYSARRPPASARNWRELLALVFRPLFSRGGIRRRNFQRGAEIITRPLSRLRDVCRQFGLFNIRLPLGHGGAAFETCTHAHHIRQRSRAHNRPKRQWRSRASDHAFCVAIAAGLHFEKSRSGARQHCGSLMQMSRPRVFRRQDIEFEGTMREDKIGLLTNFGAVNSG